MKEHRTEAVKLIGDCCGQLSALRTVRHSDDKKQEAPTGLTPEEREQCVKLFYSMLEYFCGEGSGVEASVRGHRLFNEHQDTDAETMEFIKTITDYLNGKPEVVEMFDRGLEELGKFKEGDTERKENAGLMQGNSRYRMMKSILVSRGEAVLPSMLKLRRRRHLDPKQCSGHSYSLTGDAARLTTLNGAGIHSV